MDITNKLSHDNPLYVPQRKRQNIGESIVVESPKGILNVTVPSRTITDCDFEVLGELTALARGTGVQQRDGNQVYLKGFKIFWNYHQTSAENIYLSVAVVQPNENSPPTPTDFLRSFSSERTLTINNNNVGIDGLKPINTDENLVLYHAKFKVGGLIDTTTAFRRNSNLHNSTEQDVYIHINRLVTYDDGGSATCNEKMYLVCWCHTTTREAADPLNVQGDLQCKAYMLFEDTDGF